MSRRLQWVCYFMAWVPAWAAAQAVVPGELPLDAAQKAALGIRVMPVQAAQAGVLLASARVSVPPGREVTVAAPYAGVITRLDAGLGDAVSAGAALAQWSSPQLAEVRRQAREAQLDAQNAQAALERDRAMLAEGVIPAVRVQQSQNRYLAADAARLAREAELRSAGAGAGAADYAGAALRAPIGGTVVEVLASVGQRVEAGAALFRIADTRQLQLDLTLSADKAAQLKVGDAVSVPTREARAVLIGVSRGVDASQQAQARARVTAAGALRPGELLPVQLHPATPIGQPAWQVPARAVVTHRAQPWVFVLTAGGFAPTPVRVLSSDDEQSVVEAPLSPRSQVAVTGLASLRAMLQKE